MIVSVLSTKGGVGKTTTAVNLAAALAERGRRVLVIDLDPQASASLHLGIDKARLAPSAADVLVGAASLEQAIRNVHPGLDLLTSSIDLVEFAEDRERRFTDRSLQEKLVDIRHQWDEVLIDCPPGVGPLARLALRASQSYLLPTPAHFLSMQGLQPLIDRCARFSTRSGSRVRLLGIVLTMVDDRSRHIRSNIHALRDTFPRDVFAVEIRQAAKVAEAPASGVSVIETAPKHRAANAFRLLAEEVLQRLAAHRFSEQPPAERRAPVLESASLSGAACRDQTPASYDPSTRFERLTSKDSRDTLEAR